VLTFPTRKYTFAELGGSLMPGSYPIASTPDPGLVELASGVSMPVEYINSSTFTVRWTFDGSSPETSPSATEGAEFSDGYPGDAITVSLAHFGTNTDFTVQAAAVSQNPAIATTSPIASETISIKPTQLPPPLYKFDDISGEVTLALDVDSGKIPVGATIYYSTDGTDPGIGTDNQPASGTLYSAPFHPSSNITVKARVYPPVANNQFFIVSDLLDEDVILPDSELYIGGRFFLGSGAAISHRNIARILENGTVDPTFNPGSGAEAGSTVADVLRVSSGGVLAAGNFQSMSGVAQPALIRFDANGAIDTAFNAGLK
ncbi:MAG: chitobiase/beta-hexosaminidase C-terminal domain-containing protein, partial [Verrucomicrobiales bacterium]